MLKKVISVFLCASVAALSFCGCGKSGESSQAIEYGQAVKEVNGKDIYLIYDGRFVADEEMDALMKYYVAVQNNDEALFRATQPEDYLAFLEKENNMNVNTILEDEYTSVASVLGKGFKFVELEVTDCGKKNEDKSIEDILNVIDGIYSDMGSEKSFSDTVKDAKYVTFDVTAMGTEYSYTLSDQTKYIFNCEDGIYIY